jgi:hypothetical protein
MNYVLVVFTDGDARVYTKKNASKTTIRVWNKLKTIGHTDDTAEIVAESTDKDALVRMAKLARHDYAMHMWGELTEEYTQVDRTNIKDFP